MKYELLKAMYDCFYIPPKLSAANQEVEDCHQALIDRLYKPERKLVLQVISEPEIAPTEPAAAPEPALEPMPEPIPAPEITTAPESTPEPPPTTIDSQPGDMVYVPGFGWLESQGPNHVEYAEDMYENGNKIGIMG